MEKINNCVCPCCGEKIQPNQEQCLNCMVYLWEVEDSE